MEESVRSPVLQSPWKQAINPHYPMLFLAVLVTFPGLVGSITSWSVAAPTLALGSGVAILGASFLLLWACDAAQAEVSQALALAVVALVAVLPEYAVDMYFTWQAGLHPAGSYSHYAIANMTGANRLLIGVAWGAIAVMYWLRCRKPVHVGRERRTELCFLGAATLYAFLIPLKGTLAWYDGIVFLAIYAAYVVLAARRPCVEVEAEGPAAVLLAMPTGRRRAATVLMFCYAALVVLFNARPFCEGLVATGRLWHINEFFLVQWLAPVASEAPEFVVALVFAWRGQAGLALGSLLSAKLNQWTLLVGMIPGVFAVAHGSLAHPLPLGHFQLQEILLTAAQSLLAVVILASMRFSVANALLLFGLFIGQLIVPSLVGRYPQMVFDLPIAPHQIHLFFSVLYLTAAATLFLHRPTRVLRMGRHLMAEIHGLKESPVCPFEREEEEAEVSESGETSIPIHTHHCLKCPFRLSGIRAVSSEV